jgi:hypothetical protein
MRFLLLAILLAFQPLASAAQTAGIGEDPPWVEPAALPDAGDEAAERLRTRAARGIFYHLVDSQSAWDEGGRGHYVRIAQEVIDRAGLENAATIQEIFDPATESILLTRLDILRGGARISLMGQVQWETYRRETRLEAGIIDGTLTAVIQVPGLRVGDIVDYSTVRLMKPHFPGTDRTTNIDLEYSEPVLLTRHVAFWPADWPLTVRPMPGRVIHESEARGDIVRHEWRREAHLPDAIEDHTPVEEPVYAAVEYGANAEWDWVVAAFGGHYTRDYPLPPEWEARVAEIASAHETPGARAIAALRLVQDEIRYVSLSVGAGGFLARDPAAVLASGFGDCKDKSLLLVAILRRLGIEAETALADLDEGYALAGAIPSLYAFDHMIVRARIGENFYWFDPTMSHQGGGLETNAAPDIGYALPLGRAEGAGLALIEPRPGATWASTTTETFTFSLAGVTLDVTTVARGMAADSWRYDLATTPLADTAERFLDYYRGLYPGIESTEPISVSDNRAENEVILRERYYLTSLSIDEYGLRQDFPFGAEDFSGWMREALSGHRRAALLVGSAQMRTHKVVVRNAPVEFIVPEPVRLSNPAFQFVFKAQGGEAGNMELTWQYRTSNRSMPASEAAAVLRDSRTVSDNYIYYWSLEP